MACRRNPFLGSSLVSYMVFVLGLRGFISHIKELVKTFVEQVAAYPILSATLCVSRRVRIYQSLLAGTNTPFKNPSNALESQEQHFKYFVQIFLLFLSGLLKV